MKYRQKVLLLTGPANKNERLNWDKYDFFPGSRLRNYRELLTGYGIPYAIQEAGKLRPSDIVTGSQVRYTSIIFTRPLAKVNSDLLFWIAKYSYEYGVTLVADSFLLKRSLSLDPFGISEIGGTIFNGREIKDEKGNSILAIKKYPYAPKGFALGARPLHRFLLQNWFSKKLNVNQQAAMPAVYGPKKPAVIACSHGKARNYLLNFHPSFVLKEGNAMHDLIRKCLEINVNLHALSFDFTGHVCLRMDDPGSCERVHLEGYNPAVIPREEWENLVRLIREKKAHLNVAYVPQWVDDGDKRKGNLAYKGARIEERKGGEVFNSWEVMYSRAGSPGSHNYVAEYEMIKSGVEKGIVTILSHGLTHLTTHVDDWLKAKTKYTKKEWFREFREMVRKKKASKEVLAARMAKGRELLREAFGVMPEIIAPPAHEQTSEAAIIAKEVGFKMFSSRATSFLREEETVVNRKIMAFYPEEFAEGMAYSRAGYPVIFVFHDYDICTNGASWLEREIENLEKHGARRFPSLEAVCFLLMAKMEAVSEGPELSIKLDFSGLRLPAKLTPDFEIPFKVYGTPTDITLNGSPHFTFCEKVGGFSYFSIPFSHVRDARLEMAITFRNP